MEALLLFLGNSSIFWAFSTTMHHGTVGSRIGLYHLLRCNHPEALSAPNRLQNEKSSSLDRQGHRPLKVPSYHGNSRNLKIYCQTLYVEGAFCLLGGVGRCLHGGLHRCQSGLSPGRYRIGDERSDVGRSVLRILQGSVVGLRHGGWWTDDLDFRDSSWIRQ